jgi:hypothetical protein
MGESVVGNSLAGEFADAVGPNAGPGGLPPDHEVLPFNRLFHFVLTSFTSFGWTIL